MECLLGTETLNLSPSAYQAFVGILASQSASLPGCTPQTCSATNFNPSLLTYSQVSAWPVISITLASTGTSGPAQPVTYQVAPISYFFPSKAAIEAASGTLGSLLTSSTAPVWMFYIKQSSSTFSLLGVPFVQGRAIAIAQAEGLEYIATSSASCGGVSTSGLAALTSMPVPDPVCSWGQQIVTTTVSRPNGGVTTTKPSEAYLGMGRGGALMAGIVFAIVSLVFC